MEEKRLEISRRIGKKRKAKRHTFHLYSFRRPPYPFARRRRRRRFENGRVLQKTRLPRDAVAIDGKWRRRRVFVFATTLFLPNFWIGCVCESAEEKKNVPRGREREREREREDASMNDERVPISLPRSRVPRARRSFFLSFFLTSFSLSFSAAKRNSLETTPRTIPSKPDPRE